MHISLDLGYILRIYLIDIYVTKNYVGGIHCSIVYNNTNKIHTNVHL